MHLGFNSAASIETELLAIRDRHLDCDQIIIFAPSLKWEARMFQRPQQLARALARQGALVFYLQPYEPDRPPLFSELETRLIVCNTPTDVFHVFPNAFVYLLPWNINLQAYFPSARLIYDYLDDLSLFEGGSEHLQSAHNNILSKAEIILTTAEDLLMQVSGKRPDALLLPNGVDYEHFAKSDITDPPEDMKAILDMGKPVVGYHGALARWFDYDLVKFITRSRRDLSFVLVGLDHDNTLSSSGILDEVNVYWLGGKPYSQLPAYIFHFDIGVIPFVVNKITNATSPIKLFEYLSAGKPVVASSMRESQRVGQVLVAGTPQEWIDNIDRALEQSENIAMKETLQQTARENTWVHRADDILGAARKFHYEFDQPWLMRWQFMRSFLIRPIHMAKKVFKIWHMYGFRSVVAGVYYKLLEKWISIRSLIKLPVPALWINGYILEDNSQVTLYTDDSALCPDYQPRRSLQVDHSQVYPAVTLISTCKNEEESADKWIRAVARQTRIPDEIVVVDGGSTDRTLEVIRQEAKQHNLNVRILTHPDTNIAAARNIAIQNALSPIIVSLDFGCVPLEDWLEKLILPFEIDPKTEVSAGWFLAVNANGKASRFRGWTDLKDIAPQHFIPSSRSLAFTKKAWEQAGGYPEWLTLTGEDTYFALELKRFSVHWAFTPHAVVEWKAPRTLIQMWQKVIYWANGDGEIGYNAYVYLNVLRRIQFAGLALGFGVAVTLALLWRFASYKWWAGFWFLLAVWLILFAGITIFSWVRAGDPFHLIRTVGMQFSQVIGFWQGTKRREQVAMRRFKQTKGLVFLLAGVPIDDTGGGARSTQLALEFLRQNFWVVYINRFPKQEAQAANVQIGHPNLIAVELKKFDWQQFAHQFKALLPTLDKYAIVEFPVIEFLLLTEKMKLTGCKIIYEMIDDWNSSLGGSWYTEDLEQKFIENSDMAIATAPVLQQKMERMSGQAAKLLPNAVNSRLFNPDRLYRRPVDLPEADWIAIYVGALWGDWFDWGLLKTLALHYPEAAIVAIGDYHGQCEDPPANLKFLGLKPQSVLPSYLAHVDVTIIPWKNNAITQATSPLKLYEYLAMRCPVVAPTLNPLYNIPGVFLAKDNEEFIHLIDEVRKKKLPLDDINAFIERNNWQARITQLVGWLNNKN